MADGQQAGRDTPTRVVVDEAEPPSLARPSIPARWKVERLLGSGGQADVWLALDTVLGERVAVKVFRSGMSASARERLRREVTLGRSLNHRGLVRVYELIDGPGGDSLGGAAVVMEWLAEGNLLARLADGPFGIDELVRLAADVLRSLSFLHSKGIVHRDVKPSNLLLGSDGRVRLADLGLVRLLDEHIDLTHTAVTVGTPTYMSPEQVRGEPATHAADLYAFGATLYHLLTGQPPFEAGSEFEVARLHMQERPPDPRRLRPDCPGWLARFVLRLMEKLPRDRFPSADAALSALRRRRVLSSPRIRRRLAGGLGVAALLAAALAALAPGIMRMVRPHAVRLEAVGSTATGRDAAGRALWSVSFEQRIMQVEQADLDGDGEREWVVTAADRAAMDRGDARRRGQVAVIRANGSTLTSVHPEDVVTDWPYEYALELTPRAHLLDLDADRLPELVVVARHPNFFPTAILVFWPRLSAWQHLVNHSGVLDQVLPLPDRERPRLRFAGVNNRLCMLPIIAEIELEVPRVGGERGEWHALVSADFGLGGTTSLGWSWYTLLAEGGAAQEASLQPDGGTRIVKDGRALVIDRWGNPPGPNAGRDLQEQRAQAWEAIGDLRLAGASLDAATIEASIGRSRAKMGPLADEPEMRAVLELTGARLLARAGDLPAAITTLEALCKRHPYEDAVFRLAQLRALAGDLDSPIRLLLQVANEGRTPRAAYDVPLLLLRLAIERRDRALLSRMTGIFSEWDRMRASDVVSIAAARARVWWDEVGVKDAEVRSWSYMPEGDAIAGLARWRLGRARADDPETMRSAVERNQDAAFEGRLALGASLLGTRRADEAEAVLGALITTLEPRARDDFMERQVLDLARGLHVRALWDAGRADEALQEASRVAASLREGLLPRVLVDEVLRQAQDAGLRP